MTKIDIKDLSKAELGKALEALGAEPYRAGQIFRWLYRSGAKRFDDMTDIPAALRERLKAKFHITHLATLDSKSSRADDTAKYLFRLEDGNTIEAVYLPEPRRTTVCVSSQVGCKFSCSFCASAPFGFVRNLKSSEILDEVLSVRALKPSKAITNVVFMGIGEPLDNYDNVMKAVRVINDPDGLGIGARRITISTCGIIPGIRKLSAEGVQVELSVSLHSADDAKRSVMVPANKRYPLKGLIDACKEYTEATGRVITFEYVLIGSLNSSEEDALMLAGLLKGLKCKVNAISYNKIKAIDFEEPPARSVALFMKTLRGRGISATHRKSKGDDIDAGCGQLRISRL
jgi:23S rRNA (adenine2503-C2)-methyltransferase